MSAIYYQFGYRQTTESTEDVEQNMIQKLLHNGKPSILTNMVQKFKYNFMFVSSTGM